MTMAHWYNAPPLLDAPRRTLPLAIAKSFRMPLAPLDPLGQEDVALDRSTPWAYFERRRRHYSAAELQSDVEVHDLHPGVGRIDIKPNQKGEPRYVVYDKYGDYKDTLLVDERGEVCYAGDDVGGSLASSSTPPRMSQWHRIDSYASWRWVPLKPWDSRTHLPPELYHGGWFDANHFLEVDLGTKTVRLCQICRPRAGIYTKMQSLDIIKRTTLNTKPISSVQNN